MLMCVVVGAVSLFQKDFSTGIEALILGFLLSPYGIPMVGAAVTAFLQGINEAKNYRLFLCKFLRREVILHGL